MKKIIALSLIIIITISIIFYQINDDRNDVAISNDIYREIDIVPFQEITYEPIEIIIETPDPYEVAIAEMQNKMITISEIDNHMEWYIAYKSIVQEYSNILDPPETIYDYFTEQEINLICRVVETETYQCDFESKVNVACVVFNRLESGSFGETIKEVVTAKNQFAYGRKNISEDTILAVEYAFEIEDTTNGALFFHSNVKTDTFCGANYIFSDDAVHHFYK